MIALYPPAEDYADTACINNACQSSIAPIYHVITCRCVYARKPDNHFVPYIVQYRIEHGYPRGDHFEVYLTGIFTEATT